MIYTSNIFILLVCYFLVYNTSYNMYTNSLHSVCKSNQIISADMLTICKVII